MADLFHEFARIFGKYGQQWTEDYRRDRGEGWEGLRERPATAEEYNRLFLQYVNTGHKVYAEIRNGRYSIWVKPLSESREPMYRAGKPTKAGEVYIEFTEIYRKHGRGWADTFKKELAKGWQRVGTERDDLKVEKMFIDYAKKGYMVNLEKTGAITAPHYVIYVKKLPGSNIPAVHEYTGYSVREKRTARVLKFKGYEFVERPDGFIDWDTTKRFYAPHNTIEKSVRTLKYRKVPYEVTTKEVD